MPRPLSERQKQEQKRAEQQPPQAVNLAEPSAATRPVLSFARVNWGAAAIAAGQLFYAVLRRDAAGMLAAALALAAALGVDVPGAHRAEFIQHVCATLEHAEAPDLAETDSGDVPLDISPEGQ